MNFTLKALVAAVALAAAGSASAAAIVNVDTASSDVFLAVYDYSNKASAVFDLGNKWSFSDISGGTAVSDTVTLTSDASWVSLLGATGVTTSTLKWAIFAGSTDTTGTATALLETLAVGTNPAAGSAYKQNTVNAQITNIGNFLTTAGNKGLTQGGSIYTSGTTNAPFVGTTSLLGSLGKQNATGSTVVNALDSFASLIQYDAADSVPANSVLTKFSTSVGFKLSSSGVLSFTGATAAVPETDTYAMLLAGLGVMGLVARRRLAA